MEGERLMILVNNVPMPFVSNNPLSYIITCHFFTINI